MSLELSILRHTIGADKYGQRRGDRNYFITGPRTTDYPTCVDLVERGLMYRTPGNSITSGNDVFRLTDAGFAHVRDTAEVDQNRYWLCLAPWREEWETEAWFKVRAETRSKARYEAFLYLGEVRDLDGKDLIRIRVKAAPRPKPGKTLSPHDGDGSDDLPF
ncbi:hypothetical protein LFL96_20925 [Paraburkholderia sp. D15]|uniref:hypothetical protein n=1 Tax=Paraburkholderia sp. D15 TaxID=2880218 RepID=UPI002479210E|nr:hypothetical protein [Paraburkholderia sp. D15]WGS53525.1 hypothetical protein LFL96_20925 [Paraburkholderia sp. D15]